MKLSEQVLRSWSAGCEAPVISVLGGVLMPSTRSAEAGCAEAVRGDRSGHSCSAMFAGLPGRARPASSGSAAYQAGPSEEPKARAGLAAGRPDGPGCGPPRSAAHREPAPASIRPAPARGHACARGPGPDTPGRSWHRQTATGVHLGPAARRAAHVVRGARGRRFGRPADRTAAHVQHGRLHRHRQGVQQRGERPALAQHLREQAITLRQRRGAHCRW